MNKKTINIVESVIFSHEKQGKSENEDAILTPYQVDNGYLIAVADGVGSYKGASLASKTAINYLGKIKEKTEIYNLKSLFSNIRAKITSKTDSDPELSRAATTLTFCYIDTDGLTIGHIGDCRLYLNSNQKLVQITKDHTQLQQLIDEKLFSKKYLKGKKAKNILTTAISKNIEMKFDSTFIATHELPIDENGNLSIYIMSDGAHHFWDKRPRFAKTTMKSLTKFSASILRRIEANDSIDDYSLVGITVQYSNHKKQY